MKKSIWISAILAFLFIATPVVQCQNHSKKEIKRELRQLKRELRKSADFSERDLRRMQEEIARIKLENRHLNWIDEDEFRDQVGQQREMARKFAEQQREFAQRQSEWSKEHANKLQQELKALKWKNGNGIYYFHSPDFEFDFKMPEIEVPDIKIPDLKNIAPNARVFNYYHQDENSNFNIRKELEENSGSAEYDFEVKDDATRLDMSVNGELASGNLMITLTKPNGTVYQKIDISPLADVNWKQGFDIDPVKQSDNFGIWKIAVSSNEASGKYSLHISAR